MKKWIAWLLCLAVLFSLTACSGKQEDTGDDESQTEAQAQEAEPVKAEPEIEKAAEPEAEEQKAGEQPQEPEPEEQPKKEKPAIPDGEFPPFDESATIEETVLVDQDQVRITATELVYSGYDVKVKLTIENNTNKTLTFYSNTYALSCNSINGCMINDGYLSSEVGAGKKSVETVGFGVSSLQLYGINVIADIELGIYAQDEEYTKTFYEITPIYTSAADTYEYRESAYRDAITSDGAMSEFGYTIPAFTTETGYDQENVKIESLTVAEKEDGKQIAFLEAVNHGQEPVNVVINAVSINGLALHSSEIAACTVMPGKRGIVTLSLESALERRYWEAYGLSEPGNLTLDVILRDMDDEQIGKTKAVTVVSGDASFDRSGTELYNQGGLCVISKGMYGPDSKYDSAVYWCLLVENGSNKELDADFGYESLSVNDFMMPGYADTISLGAGESGVLIVRIPDSGLTDAGIADLEAITKIEGVVEFMKDYNTVAEAPVSEEF